MQTFFIVLGFVSSFVIGYLCRTSQCPRVFIKGGSPYALPYIAQRTCTVVIPQKMLTSGIKYGDLVLYEGSNPRPSSWLVDEEKNLLVRD